MGTLEGVEGHSGCLGDFQRRVVVEHEPDPSGSLTLFQDEMVPPTHSPSSDCQLPMVMQPDVRWGACINLFFCKVTWPQILHYGVAKWTTTLVSLEEFLHKCVFDGID